MSFYQQPIPDLLVTASPLPSLDRSAAYSASSVQVDNQTNQWLFFPDLGRYVAPYRMGAILDCTAIGGAERCRAQFQTPIGFVAPVIVSGQVATITWYAERLPPSSGIDLTPLTSDASQQLVATIPLTNGTTITTQIYNLPAGTHNLALALDFGLAAPGTPNGISSLKAYGDPDGDGDTDVPYFDSSQAPSFAATYNINNPSSGAIFFPIAGNVIGFIINCNAQAAGGFIYVYAQLAPEAMVVRQNSVDSFNVAPSGGAPPLASVATVTQVAASASRTLLLVHNSKRVMASLFNQEGAAKLYIALDSIVGHPTTSLFVVELVPGAYFELPIPVYTGDIYGIWASATGAVNVTEWVT